MKISLPRLLIYLTPFALFLLVVGCLALKPKATFGECLSILVASQIMGLIYHLVGTSFFTKKP